ncbi:hypothetical protein XENORESO_012984 [Xenotaenia resolanae]|uniref:Uncharacterized protein n=1 Tax=Xenotaenia resolanae TaxID=208358 RepID=A0ABV0W0J6_9TELE
MSAVHLGCEREQDFQQITGRLNQVQERYSVLSSLAFMEYVGFGNVGRGNQSAFSRAGVYTSSLCVPLSCNFWMHPCSNTPESDEWLITRPVQNVLTYQGGYSRF